MSIEGGGRKRGERGERGGDTLTVTLGDGGLGVTMRPATGRPGAVEDGSTGARDLAAFGGLAFSDNHPEREDVFGFRLKQSRQLNFPISPAEWRRREFSTKDKDIAER